MKVLMFGWEFPPLNSGGLGVACYGLTRALSRAGVEVTFVLPRKADLRSSFVRFVFAGLDAPFSAKGFHSGYMTSKEWETLAAGHRQYGWGLMDEVRQYALRARQIAKEEQFDIIHAHDWLTILAGIEAKKVSGKPLVVHMHATEFDRTGNGSVNQDVYEIERAGMHFADRVIAVSEYTKRILVERYGVPAWKIDVVHNAVDDDDEAATALESDIHALKNAGNKIVLFVGRITLQKGPDYFVRVAKRVLEHRRDVYFVICGSGDMERQIMQQAAFLGITDRLFFVGFLRGQELAKLYRLSDVLIMPSVSEPFGIVPLEALRNGTPVIISKQSGVAEVLHHALKADFWDVDEMADFILAITTYAPLRQCLADLGGKEASKRKWAHAAHSCVALYSSILDMYHRRRREHHHAHY